MRKVGLLFMLIIVLASLATPVLADGPEGDVIIWGESYTLASGERIRGDLFVYGGNVDLEDGSQVDGSVAVFGGNLNILGEVDGDVTVWGGNVDIGATATIRGQVVSIGGQVHRDEGADVRGDEIEGFPFRPPVVPRPPIPPRISRVTVDRPWGSEALRQIGHAFRSAFGILLMIVLGVLVVVFLPRHTETVAETMLKVPAESFVSGIVALVGGAVALTVVSIVAGLLMITVCLAPVGLLLLLPFLVAGVALLLGWIAAGLLLGVKVLRALTHKEPNHVTAVAVGILLLSLLSFIPCLGGALVLIVVTWSLGAVIYSLFGTRAYDEPAPRIPFGKPKQYDPRMDKV